MNFSVVLCTYNGARYLREQIESILRQTRAVDEIIVSDDGSSDDTLLIAEQTLSGGSVRYRIVQNQGEHGVAGNFLNGLRLASGDYIFTCDQDDIWLENKVEIFAAQAEQSKKMLYFSDGLLVDGAGVSLHTRLWETLGFSCDTDLPTSEQIFARLLRNPLVTGAAMMVSKELVAMTEEIPCGWIHDEWLAITAASVGSILPIPQVTFHYRQHGKNVLGATKYSFLQKVKIWLKNASELPRIRKNAHERYQAFLPYCTEDKREQLGDCVAFWEQMLRLNEIGRVKGQRIITAQYRLGNYHKYYTGRRGAVRDRIAVALRLRSKKSPNPNER